MSKTKVSNTFQKDNCPKCFHQKECALFKLQINDDTLMCAMQSGLAPYPVKSSKHSLGHIPQKPGIWELHLQVYVNDHQN